MKFDGIKHGMKIQKKDTGDIYTIIYVNETLAETDRPHEITEFCSGNVLIFKSSNDAKHFRKYKGD